jgi:hypothetical protein
MNVPVYIHFFELSGGEEDGKTDRLGQALDEPPRLSVSRPFPADHTRGSRLDIVEMNELCRIRLPMLSPGIRTFDILVILHFELVLVFAGARHSESVLRPFVVR